jgi:glycosidase
MSINIYQVFTRLFRNDNGQNISNGTIEQNGCSKFNHFDDKAVIAIKEMGFTYVWLTGVIRHACCTPYTEDNIAADYAPIVKGKAGSPYAIRDYYDVAPDLAEDVPNRMNEFEELVERFHKHDLKVIIDFVPNHLARQYKSEKKPLELPEIGELDDQSVEFSPNNNFYYLPYEKFKLPEGIEVADKSNYLEYPAKATGNNVFRCQPNINDWYETIKLNYGVDFKNGAKAYFEPTPPTWQRMYEIVTFWAKKGVDGIRVDMADMVPMSFWKWLVPKIKENFPGITFIAEAYQPAEYKDYIEQAKFDWLYDKEQFYNTVRSIVEGKNYAGAISQVWKEQDNLGPHLLRFLENHDEHRIGSEFFAQDPQKAKSAMVLAATMHKGPLMIYFGQELGEKGMYEEGFSGLDGKTSIFDYWKVESVQNWVNKGKFDTENLSSKSLALRNWYIKLLHFRNQYNVFEKGEFYDLMWQNEHLNEKYFIYFRHSEEIVMLFIIAFNINEPETIEINLPYHALDHIGLDFNKEINIEQVFENRKNIVFNRSDEKYTLEITMQESTGYAFKLS